jgi:tetratricopeptide (TPR) repeat protein
MAAWLKGMGMLVICLGVLGGWCRDLAAHRRAAGPLPRVVANYPAPGPDPKEQLSLPPALTAAAYWQRVEALAAADRPAALQETVLALLNLFPRSPEAGAALLKLAHQAKLRGETAKSLELLGLAARVGQGPLAAGQARLAAASLELSEDLAREAPARAFRSFLEKLDALASCCPATEWEVTLAEGWQLLARQVEALDPCPLPLLEELLALWEQHPQGIHPAEGALLLADLLKKQGLVEEARVFLDQAAQASQASRSPRLATRALELIWLSRGWFGVKEFLQRHPQERGELSALLCSWLTLPSSREPGACPPPARDGNPAEALWAWLLPREAHAGPPERALAVLERALKHSWPAFIQERLHHELAGAYLLQGNFSQAATIYQDMASKAVIPGTSPFYRDRLGMSRWREGCLDAAHASFRLLERENDPLWQQVGKVRLTDLELARLQAATFP